MMRTREHTVLLQANTGVPLPLSLTFSYNMQHPTCTTRGVRERASRSNNKGRGHGGSDAKGRLSVKQKIQIIASFGDPVGRIWIYIKVKGGCEF